MKPITRRFATAALLSTILAHSENAEGFFGFRGGAPIVVTTQPLTASQFTLKNWNGSGSSPGYFQFGMIFKKGDVPATATVELRRGAGGATSVPCQFDERTYFSDGSLQKAIVRIRDVFYSAGEARLVSPYVVPNTTWDNSGPFTVATVIASGAPAVDFANVTQTDNSSTTKRGSGSFTLDFNTVLGFTKSGQATRLDVIGQGPISITVRAWGMAVDNGTLTEDPDLKGYVYATLYNDGMGGVLDVERWATIGQDWWASPAGKKYKLNYDATFRDGVTTLHSYPGVQNPYHSKWATVPTVGASDLNAGRPMWKNAAPTLSYMPNRAYWVSTGLLPSFNVAAPIVFGVNRYTTTTYTPCGAMNVNAFIDAEGGSNGRGQIMDSDTLAFLSQRQNDVMIARISALSGFGVPYHLRSNDTRTRPQDGGVSDIASSPMSLTMLPNIPSYYTFTAQGMPAPVEAYRGSATTSAFTHGYQTPTGGYSWGGAAPWSPSSTSSHASMYTYFMYFLEGHRHYLDCQQDMCTNALQSQNGNNLTGRPNLLYYLLPTYQTTLGIPSTLYSGINNMRVSGNTRATGWALMLMSIAASMTPPQDAVGNGTPEWYYFKALNNHNLQYCADSMAYIPASQLAAGWWIDFPANSVGINSPWMQSFIGMGAYANYKATENLNAQALGHFMANHATGLVNTNIYRTVAYRVAVTPKSGGAGSVSDWNPATNDYFDISQVPFHADYICSVSNADSYFTVTTAGYMPLANGNIIYPSGANNDLTAKPIPAELTPGTPYYVVNWTGTRFQLSASPGGASITFAANYTGTPIAWYGAQQGAYTVAQYPPYTAPADSYSPINRCLLVDAVLCGKAGAAAALAANQTFLSQTDATNYTQPTGQFFSWSMAVPLAA